jgi:hypothetical protein
MFNKIALLALLSLPCAALAQEGSPRPASLEESDSPTIGYNTVAEALAAVRANPNSRVVADWDWTTLEIGKIGQPEYALWSFSPPSHPAHPSAVKRTVYVREGQVVVDMDVACEAAGPVCDQMVRDFQTLNLKFQKALNAPR